jgi:sarcosine oxidase, subunit delta
MLLIHCPYCETDRPELEFRYAGQAHIARPADPETMSDEDWAKFLYFRANPRGLHAERWRHTNGCARFFNCLRDTVTDKIQTTYKAGRARPEAAR